MSYRERHGSSDMVTAAPARGRVHHCVRQAAPRGERRPARRVLRRRRYREHAGRGLLVAGPSRLTGLDPAGSSGAGRRVLVLPPPGPAGCDRDPGRVHRRPLTADLPGWPPDSCPVRHRVGTLRDRSGRLRAVLLPEGPARRVRRGGRADHDRGQGLGPIGHGDHDRPAAYRVRPPAGSVLQCQRRGDAGAAGPRRAGGTRTPPARRAGQGGRAGQDRWRDARRRDARACSITATDQTTKKAAEELRAAGCQALDELRDLVGILRREPEDAADQTPSVSGLPTLISESAAVGTPTELVEDGDRSLASPVVGRTAYRMVREGLTNARKHAPGSRVLVQVSYGESEVRVTVTNTPPAGPPTAAAGLAKSGSGLGLEHLRQRIELVHGALEARPTPDGGFRLEARLPAYVPTAEPAA